MISEITKINIESSMTTLIDFKNWFITRGSRVKSLHSFTSCLEVYTLYSYTVWMILSHPKTTLLWKLHTEGSNTLRGLTARTLHTRVEPVGRVAKMNWLNYDMGMKIHANCDTKNAILKYFSLDMWKFTQIWAFFFLYGEF